MTTTVRTARYKLAPSAQQYQALREARFQCMRLRNACLQELVDSYRAARRQASLHGRDRPIAEDWKTVRGEEIVEFLAWQDRTEPDLRRRHGQAEQHRIAKATKLFEAGGYYGPVDQRTHPWRPKDAESFGRAISKQDQMRRLAEIRAADPKGIGALPLQILRDQVDIVHKAMDAFYKRVKLGQNPGFPRFKGFDRIRSIASPFGDGLRLDGDRLRSMAWHGGLPVRMHRDLPGEPKTIRLTYDGRFWFVTIACEVEIATVAHARAGSVCGADAGVRRLLTFDDGSFVENPKFLEADAPETRRLARRLARCRRASHQRRKARRALARARQRTANRRRTHLHKVSKELATRSETIFVEDLRLANMTRSAAGTAAEPGTGVAQKRGLNRAMLDASISTLISMTSYKAESAGGKVVRVDPRNTSRDCSECGGREKDALSRVRYSCSCSADLDRDHNAARNILARGLLAA